MKKVLFIILAIIIVSCSSVQNTAKSSKNILESRNIAEIENYLKTAHPDDPKRRVLKPKLIALKNLEWTKGKKNAKPMEARPVISDIPKSRNSAEAEEFQRLISSTSKEHTEKTIKLLNTMFNDNANSKEAIILFRNKSDCNLIVKIQGIDFYTIAVPANGENTIVVNKGNYTLTSNVCDVLYSSNRDINKSILFAIGNPVEVAKK